MSQEKVDRYKKEKANRRETIARHKRNVMIAKVCGIIVAAAIVCLVAKAGYRGYVNSIPAENYTVSTTAISDYLESLDPEDSEAE